jgi:hypothetical protein
MAEFQSRLILAACRTNGSSRGSAAPGLLDSRANRLHWRFHAMERSAIDLNSDSPLHGQERTFLRLPELRRGV